MRRSLCRLCSSKEKIVDVYHPQLESGEQLRHYILLASGINILWNDPISRMVCHRCCEIAVKLHKYRSNAIANDKLLKEKCGQLYTPPIKNQDELLSAASKICNINEIGINGSDPLELLNIYVKSGTKKTKTLKPVTDDDNSLSYNGATNILKVSNDTNISLKEATKSSAPSPLRPSETTSNQVSDKSTEPNNKINEVIPNDEVVEPLNNDLNGSKHLLNCDTFEAPSCYTANNHKDVDNMKDCPEVIITEMITEEDEMNIHPSIKTLFKEYNFIKVPKEVYSSDVSPMISLDATEVSDWYAEQLRKLKEKLKSATTTYSNPLSSSDEDSNVSRPRLRRRKRRRIIDCSDTDDDEEWLPFKMQAQEVKTTKPSRPLISASSVTPVNTAPAIQNIYSTNLNKGVNYAVVTSGNLGTQPTNKGLKLKIMKYTPLTTVPSASDAFIVTQPNSCVLQSLLTSNDQTLASLYTDFSKYGINIEAAEPPIHYSHSTEFGNISSVTGATREIVVPQTPPETVVPQVSAETVVIENKGNDDIIYISDDENDVPSKSSDDYNFMNATESEMMQLLLKKHFKRQCQESQTFYPTNAVIHRTKTNLLALPNMLGELKRYKIPIDLEFSSGNTAHFEKNIPRASNSTMDKWLPNECIDVLAPAESTADKESPSTTKSISSNTQWNQSFLQQINSAIINHASDYSHIPTVINGSILPVISNSTVPAMNNSTMPAISNTAIPVISNCTIPVMNHSTVPVVSNTIAPIISSSAIPVLSNATIPIVNSTLPVTAPMSSRTNYSTIPDLIGISDVIACDKTKVVNRKPLLKPKQPIILNGNQNLSLRSLLFSQTKANKDNKTLPTSNSCVNSPLLQTYLETKTVVAPNKVPVGNEQQENQLPSIINLVDNVPQSDMPSKIRVKPISELLK